jgi:N-terminal half of MaoC dehydratase
VPIDRKHIGFSLAPFTVLVDHEQLRRFAEAIGNSVHSGLAPPTYMKVIEGKNGSSRAIVAALGVDLRRVMHVEQEFEYGAPIRGGDHVTVERRVVDIYGRKDGAHEFVVVESALQNGDGVSVGRSTQRILVRNEVQIAPA